MAEFTVAMDDGVQLHVKVLGGVQSDKPVFVSLHGAPGLSTHAEQEQAFRFLASHFRVLVYDARGSGTSDHAGPYTHERWIADVEALRRWIGADRIVLSGCSYGGFVSLDYALAHGDRLSGLILVDTWTNGARGCLQALAHVLTSDRVRPDTARQVRLWSGTLRDDADFAASIQEIIPVYAPPQKDGALARFAGQTDGSQLKGHAATQNAAFSINMPRFNVSDRLSEIKTPTLVLVGRHDVITPVSFAEELVAGIPNARLEIFDHSGHIPAEDETDKFQQVVLDFTRRL